VVGDRPADQAAGVAVDHGGQVQELPAPAGQVGDVTDVLGVRGVGGEVAFDQVRHDLVGRLGDRGAHPPAQPDPGDAVRAHHPGDPLVVHALPG
jgi:hypothetical protein